MTGRDPAAVRRNSAVGHVVPPSRRALPDDLPDARPDDRSDDRSGLADVPEPAELAERSAGVVHEHAVRLAARLLAAERGCRPQEALLLLVEAAVLAPPARSAVSSGRPIHQQAYRVLAARADRAPTSRPPQRPRRFSRYIAVSARDSSSSAVAPSRG